jgi:hypothetical protein
MVDLDTLTWEELWILCASTALRFGYSKQEAFRCILGSLGCSNCPFQEEKSNDRPSVEPNLQHL